MRITFLGGADEVGASCILLEWAGKRILIDAGVRPSPRARAGVEADQLPDLGYIDQVGGLDVILVTHAHADHTGALELVVAQYPQVPVYATPVTIALTRVLHADSRRIMQSRLEEEGELPLFDEVATERLLNALKPVPLNMRVSLGNGLSAIFFHAGHIAGAAMISIESSNPQDGGRLLISGDISISPQRTVDGVKPPNFKPDVLILESTYGGRLHANRTVEERRLVETVTRVTDAGGKVLIPAFALGRAQEVLLTLNEFRRQKRMPDIPVWADGMVRAICAVYAGFVDWLPLALQERGGRFFEGRTQPIERPDQRNALIWNDGPAVIVASSGMLMGGPSLMYARALATKSQHAILLTGYQDEESPGKRLQEMAASGKRGTLRLGNDSLDAQCQLGVYSLSAHADEAQLVSLVEFMDAPDVFLVHGESSARESLQRAITSRQRQAHLPRAGQSYEFRLPPVPVVATTFKVDMSAWQRQLDHIAQQAQAQTTNPPTPAKPQTSGPIEPNSALAIARQLLPPEARLRKCGYNLAQSTLLLTFDFPEVAQTQYAEALAQLAEQTGWQVKVEPEANHAALSQLARELIGSDWQFIRTPSIHRGDKRVEVEISGGTSKVAEARQRFHAASGYELHVTMVQRSETTVATNVRTSAKRMEINAAYGLIKSRLAGSSLYRTSLKGAEIVLSFISAQVGERYRAQIDELAQQTGYPLAISPAPNQDAILQAARTAITEVGGVIAKGPSIFVERAEVSVTLGSSHDADVLGGVCERFMQTTGYTLSVNGAVTTAMAEMPSTQAAQPIFDVVEIPIARIQLSRALQETALNRDKLRQAVDRARRMGITPPVQVRRLRDSYLLLDGLYRLEAAKAVGLMHVPAVVTV